MKTKRLIKHFSVIMLLASTFACSAKVESPQAVPDDNNKYNDVGPFDITFDTNNIYSHAVNIKLAQDEGFIEYKINPGVRLDLMMEENNSSVTGCDAQNVKHEVFWFPNESNKTTGQVLKPNSKFFTSRKTAGVIIQSFKNLQNCTGIEIKTKLKKEIKATKVGQVCQGFASADQCKLTSYCKEKIVATPYYEVEVWNQQGVLTAKKYLVRNDGTRGLMSEYTVTLADSINSAVFSSTLNSNFLLTINNITYDGTSTENIGGNPYYLSLACEI